MVRRVALNLPNCGKALLGTVRLGEDAAWQLALCGRFQLMPGIAKNLRRESKPVSRALDSVA